MYDWTREVTWDAGFNSSLESEICLERKKSPLGYSFEDAVWTSQSHGTAATMLATLKGAVRGLTTSASVFYIGISTSPIKRWLGKATFPEYDVQGHCETYMMMTVLGYGEAQTLGIMERALIDEFRPEHRCNNSGRGGERCGPRGSLGFIYLCRNEELL